MEKIWNSVHSDTYRFYHFDNVKQQKQLPIRMHPEHSFCLLLERECARADRNGQRFSVVVFHVKSALSNGKVTRHLQKVLTKRLRFTDEVGWIDKEHIGSLLFNTSADVARDIANSIQNTFVATILPPNFDVYTYPVEDQKCDNRNANSKSHQHTKSKPSSLNGEISLSSQVDPKEKEGSILPVKEITSGLTYKMPVWKRVMDIMGSLLGLLILSPLLLFVACLIKIVSPGPIFFNQERIGSGGKTFTMFKFRTMHRNVDTKFHKEYLASLINETKKDGKSGKPMTKIDEQIGTIRYGNLMRNTAIDELPQLINVLRGEMSLVGPRPPITYEVDEYLNWHKSRFDIVPGMTGLWQVSGKNRLSFNEMIRLDIRYAKRISIFLDMKILFMTPIAIISQFKDYIHLKKQKRKGVKCNA